MGRRHRDHSTTGSTLKQRSNSALQRYFFGPECDKKLSVKKFLELHSELQEEITRLEVRQYIPSVSHWISMMKLPSFVTAFHIQNLKAPNVAIIFEAILVWASLETKFMRRTAICLVVVVFLPQCGFISLVLPPFY